MYDTRFIIFQHVVDEGILCVGDDFHRLRDDKTFERLKVQVGIETHGQIPVEVVTQVEWVAWVNNGLYPSFLPQRGRTVVSRRQLND